MKKTIWLLGLVMTLLVSQVAVAQHDHEHEAPSKDAAEQGDEADAQHEEERIRLLLSGYDYFPTRQKLEEVSPRAHEILMAIAQDEKALPSMRNRALDALGLFEGHHDVALFFEVTLAAGEMKRVHLRHAIDASMKAFGPQALPWVSPYLEVADLQVRLSAVHAIGNFGGVDGLEVLKLRKDFERDQLVLDNIKKFDAGKLQR